MTRPPPRSTRTDTLFPSPTLFRSLRAHDGLAATGLGRDDNQRRQAGDLVKLPCDRRAFLDILEADRAGVLGHDRPRQRIPIGQTLPRSEEHTSELQSLMRISYAVLCLKKKKNK